MKNIIKSLMAIVMVTGIISCSDESNFAYVTPASSFAITSPTSGSAILNALYPTNPGISLTWDAANFGTPTPIDYTVEFAKAGTDFAGTVYTATTTTKNYVSLNVEELNVASLAAGLDPFSPGELNVRIKATIGSQADLPKYSDIITYTVTPYSTDLPKIYVVGNFLNNSGYGTNWTPANAVPLAASAFGKTDFEGFVNMNEASFEYKFLPTNTSFDGDYGDDGSFSGTLVQTGESNCTGTGANYYYVKANTGVTTGTNPNGLSYTVQPASWAITGNATPLNWPAGPGGTPGQDQNLTYNTVSKKWEFIIQLTAGGNEFKFRANDNWTLNLGKDGGDTDDSMDYDGGNLTVPAAGLYKVELDLSKPRKYSWSATLQ